MQSAREAARRIQCTNNLKQVALAAANYESANLCLPPGAIQMQVYGQASGAPANGTWYNSGSPFVFMLQYLEQGNAYNAANLSTEMLTCPNTTVVMMGISTLWCPSDPYVAQPVNQVAAQTFSGWCPGASVNMRYTSYSGNFGMYYGEGNNPTNASFQQAVSQMNGVIYGSSATTIGAITDGTSNTFLFIETTYGIKDPTYGGNKWWIQGHPGQTLAGSYYPVNVGKKISFDVDNKSARGIASAAAGSYHPGGANIAFCDGSVHFIKETIATWPMDPVSGNPLWVTFTNPYVANGINYPYQNNVFTLTVPVGQSMPVFQALSSRNGGEVISADQY